MVFSHVRIVHKLGKMQQLDGNGSLCGPLSSNCSGRRSHPMAAVRHSHDSSFFEDMLHPKAVTPAVQRPVDTSSWTGNYGIPKGPVITDPRVATYNATHLAHQTHWGRAQDITGSRAGNRRPDWNSGKDATGSLSNKHYLSARNWVPPTPKPPLATVPKPPPPPPDRAMVANKAVDVTGTKSRVFGHRPVPVGGPMLTSHHPPAPNESAKSGMVCGPHGECKALKPHYKEHHFSYKETHIVGAESGYPSRLPPAPPPPPTDFDKIRAYLEDHLPGASLPHVRDADYSNHMFCPGAGCYLAPQPSTQTSNPTYTSMHGGA